MWKEGWCVGLGQEGVHEGGGTVWNTLRGGGIEKRGGETKILKRASKLGLGVGALKRGDWNPLQTMKFWLKIISFKMSYYDSE